MKNLLVFISLFLLFSISSLALAQQSSPFYFVAKMDGTPIDPLAKTHILIAGYGDKMGTLFQNAAVTQARRIRDSDPTAQIVFFMFNEDVYVTVPFNQAKLEKWGLQIVRAETKNNFYDGQLIDELKLFSSISSLQVYSHGDKSWATFSLWSSRNQELQTHFLPSAYAVFYGCNAGYALAPALSQAWRIPVAAALTSGDFQRTHSNGDFYRYEEKLKPPGEWAWTNTISFNESISCSKAACIRMKPDEYPYTGVHGKYKEGLPYYKFFCLASDERACLKARARWVSHWVSNRPLPAQPTFAEYLHVVKDLLCPISSKSTIHQTCLEALGKVDVGQPSTFSGFLGPLISCNWQTCQFDQISKTSFIDEYQFYRQAFALFGE